MGNGSSLPGKTSLLIISEPVALPPSQELCAPAPLGRLGLHGEKWVTLGLLVAELTSLLIDWMWVVTEGKEPPRFVAWGTRGGCGAVDGKGKNGSWRPLPGTNQLSHTE